MDKPELPVEEILSKAIDLPPAERTDYVTQACAGNEAHLKETLSLLAAYEASDDFMEEPATLNVIGADDHDVWVGRTIDGYKLIELVDVGGMGRVYLGERADRDFVQRVAVKIVRRGAMGREGLRRFRNECRVLAMLEHPNIARMIDGAPPMRTSPTSSWNTSKVFPSTGIARRTRSP